MDKNKILGDKFENINANHVKNPGAGGRKPRVLGVNTFDFLNLSPMFSDLSFEILCFADLVCHFCIPPNQIGDLQIVLK